jgi:hypothetical protein
MRSIPRKLLIHTVEHYPKTGNDEYGTPIYPAEPNEIQFVRVEEYRGLRMTNLGDVQQDKFVMFYDPRHSTAATFSQDDKIVFGGYDLKIRDVEKFFAFDNTQPHHLEARLV